MEELPERRDRSNPEKHQHLCSGANLETSIKKVAMEGGRMEALHGPPTLAAQSPLTSKLGYESAGGGGARGSRKEQDQNCFHFGIYITTAWTRVPFNERQIQEGGESRRRTEGGRKKNKKIPETESRMMGGGIMLDVKNGSKSSIESVYVNAF